MAADRAVSKLGDVPGLAHCVLETAPWQHHPTRMAAPELDWIDVPTEVNFVDAYDAINDFLWVETLTEPPDSCAVMCRPLAKARSTSSMQIVDAKEHPTVLFVVHASYEWVLQAIISQLHHGWIRAFSLTAEFAAPMRDLNAACALHAWMVRSLMPFTPV